LTGDAVAQRFDWKWKIHFQGGLFKGLENWSWLLAGDHNSYLPGSLHRVTSIFSRHGRLASLKTSDSTDKGRNYNDFYPLKSYVITFCWSLLASPAFCDRDKNTRK
jgi:hypothetical protein